MLISVITFNTQSKEDVYLQHYTKCMRDWSLCLTSRQSSNSKVNINVVLRAMLSSRFYETSPTFSSGPELFLRPQTDKTH